MQDRLFESIILGLWLLAAVVLYTQNDFLYRGSSLISESLSFVEEEINIKKITVLDCNLFGLTIEGVSEKDIVGKLDCDIPASSCNAVKKLFRRVNKPKVVLVHKQDDNIWLVKINFFLDGKKFDLENWLVSNKLVEE